MRAIRFEPLAWEEFTDWQRQDAKLWKRLVELLNEAARTPFEGRGKPEPLKNQYTGYWSRRLTDEHRVVYKVTEVELIIVACRSHYGNK